MAGMRVSRPMLSERMKAGRGCLRGEKLPARRVRKGQKRRGQSARRGQESRQSQQKANAKPDSAYSDMKMEACSETKSIVPAPRSIRAEATRCTASLGWAGHGESARDAVVKKKHHSNPGSGSAAAIQISAPPHPTPSAAQHCSLCWAGAEKLGLQG